MLQTISSYLDAGLSVIPTHPSQKSPRIPSWTVFQKEQPTFNQIRKWFGNGHDYSPGIIAGQVSGNLEILDFDEKARQFPVWRELVEEQQPGLLSKLVRQKTQNGGLHVIYRCPDVKLPGNQKLSTGAVEVVGPGEHQLEGKGYRAVQFRGKWVICPTLIETRSEGGYFLADPGKGYQLVNGNLTEIPDITAQERQSLLECAAILSEYVREDLAQKETPSVSFDQQERPGDVFNKNTTIQSLLRQDGWKDSSRRKSLPDGTKAEMWIRPGKKQGAGATVYDNKIHVFTSSATPLEARITYDPFSYLATTQHDGDFRAAASHLSKQGYGVSENKRKSAGLSSNKHLSAEIREGNPATSANKYSHKNSKQYNDKTAPLAILIREYVEQYSGTFSVYDIDREFSIISRSEKNNRAQIMNRLAKALKIKKIHGKVGYWKTVDGLVKPMKLGQKPIEPLNLILPLGLSDMVQVLPGNIILVAGAPNTGKTAFLLTVVFTLLINILLKEKKLNNTKNVSNTNGSKSAHFERGLTVTDLAANGVRYLNSEMDSYELTDRCAAYPNGIEVFSNGCEFIQRYRDFADVITPNGINFIDFLEIHEDFFELGKLINEIHQSITTGICFIALQKKQGADYAKGGSASLEKPRLVINLDKNEGYGKICKIVKCKKTVKKGDNHDGKEIDFDIDGDSNFIRYSPWRYVNEKQRKLINRDYETKGLKPLPEKEYAFIFRLKDGSQGRVLKHQVDRWQKEYSVIDVWKQLSQIEEDSRRKPFLDDGWFYALPNILAKTKLIR